MVIELGRCPKSSSGTAIGFFSNEGKPLEPCHIHVRKGECLAKFKVDPAVELVSSWGMNSGELNQLEKIVMEHMDLIRRKWHEYFSA